MSQGLSTRAVGAPMGTTGQYSRQATAKVVPLSVFFLRMQGDEDGDEDNGLYGRKKRDAAKKSKKKGKATRGERAGGDKTVGGGADAAQAADGDGQSTASEAATMSTGTPLIAGGPTKTGATRSTTGAMGSGNVAQYPTPIGGVLRRTSPTGAPGSRKKKKKTKKDRSRWMQRLMKT